MAAPSYGGHEPSHTVTVNHGKLLLNFCRLRRLMPLHNITLQAKLGRGYFVTLDVLS